MQSVYPWFAWDGFWSVRAWSHWLALREQEFVHTGMSRIQGRREQTGCKYQCSESPEEIIDKGIVFANKCWRISQHELKDLEILTAVIIWQVSKIANSHYQLSLELVSHSRLKGKKLKYQYEMPKITPDKREC